MSKNTFFYPLLSDRSRTNIRGSRGKNLLFSERVKKLYASHHLVGNFFHYRTAIKILGWDYSDVFEDGRLDLEPHKWADFGPLNFHLGPPQGVIKELKRMTSDNNISPYPPNLHPFLKKIAARVIFKKDCGKYFEIIGTEGVQAALAYCITTFVNPGEEVIITDPGYFFLEPPVILAGGISKRITLSEKNGYRMDVDALKKKITPKTKLIMVCDPINPFGTIQTKEELREIARVANRHNIIVVNNITHCSHQISHAARHYPMSSLDDLDLENVITISGLSHGYGLAGLRIGFLAGHPDLLGPILSAKSALTRININLLMQYAAKAALEDKEYVHRCDAVLRNNFHLLEEIVNGITRLKFVIKPDYGFFACIDTSQIKASCQELTVSLLKRRCAVYPSDGLGDVNATSYIRINFSTPHEKHFLWLRKALTAAIQEAETGKYRKAVVDFFNSVGTERARTIVKKINSIR